MGAADEGGCGQSDSPRDSLSDDLDKQYLRKTEDVTPKMWFACISHQSLFA